MSFNRAGIAVGIRVVIGAGAALLSLSLAVGCGVEPGADPAVDAPEVTASGETRDGLQTVRAGCMCTAGCGELPSEDMKHGIVLFARTGARESLHLRYFPEGTEITGAQGDYIGARASGAASARDTLSYDGFEGFDPMKKKPAPLPDGVADHFGGASLTVDEAVLAGGPTFEGAGPGHPTGRATLRLRSGKTLSFACDMLVRSDE